MVASPLVDGPRLIVCAGGDSGVVALDKTTGALIWKSPNGEPEGHATPVVTSLGGVKQYLVFTGLSLLGVSPADGRILWRYPWKTGESMNAANPVVVGPDRVLVTSCDNGMALIRVAGSRVAEVWRNRGLRVYFGTPLVHRGLVFAKDDSQVLTCVDLATGATLWRQPGFGTRWYDNGGLIVGDSLIVPHGRTGDLHLVAAERSYRPLGRLASPAGRYSLVAPIVVDGRLIVRSTTQMVCLDVRGEPTGSRRARALREQASVR
jgi:outer membrane protein assembly factor BamB